MLAKIITFLVSLTRQMSSLETVKLLSRLLFKCNDVTTALFFETKTKIHNRNVSSETKSDKDKSSDIYSRDFHLFSTTSHVVNATNKVPILEILSECQTFFKGYDQET